MISFVTAALVHWRNHSLGPVVALVGVLMCADGSVAAAQSVTIVPFKGKRGPACTKLFEELITDLVSIKKWTGPAVAHSPKSYSKLKNWLSKHGARVGADIAILGYTTLRHSLIVEAYNPRNGALLGLKSLPFDLTVRGDRGSRKKRCALTRVAKKEANLWMKALIAGPDAEHPEALAKVAAESGGEEKAQKRLANAAREYQERKEPARGTSSASTAEPPGSNGNVVVSIEVELGLAKRGLSYENVQTSNLSRYEANTMAMPGFRFAAHPFALTSISPLSPLVTEVIYRRTVGLKSQRDDGPAFDTAHTEASATIDYCFRHSGSGIAIGPRFGYHFAGFLLKPSSDGSRELEIPNVAYSSLYLGVRVHAPIVSRFAVELSGAYLLVLSAGGVFEEPFFPKGSAHGANIDAGLRFYVFDRISLSLSGTYLTYRLSLNTSPTDARVADAASDTVAGIRTAARFEF